MKKKLFALLCGIMITLSPALVYAEPASTENTESTEATDPAQALTDEELLEQYNAEHPSTEAGAAGMTDEEAAAKIAEVEARVAAEQEAHAGEISTEAEGSPALPDISELPEGDGDEAAVIEAVTTSQSSETPNQVNFKVTVPERFALSCYAQIEHKESGKIYNLPLYPDNKYEQRCFVPDGSFSVAKIGVYDDSTGTYVFEIPEDFTLSNNGAIDLTSTLSNYDEVQEMIDNKVEMVTGDGKGNEEEEISVESDYEITHEGNGTGLVGIVGDPEGEYNIFIEVVKSGILGTAEIRYTMDGGLHWSEHIPIPLSAKIRLNATNDKGKVSASGLTALFDVSPLNQENGFVADDTYKCYVPDPKTEVVIDHKGSGGVVLTVIPINPESHVYDLLAAFGDKIVVSVLRSGDFGKAVVEISFDGGKSYLDEMYLPESGAIQLPGIGVILQFTKNGSGSLIEGDTYTVYAEKKTYTKAIIFGCCLLLIALVAFIIYANRMKAMIPGYGAYHISAYKPYELPESPKKRTKQAKTAKKEKGSEKK